MFGRENISIHTWNVKYHPQRESNQFLFTVYDVDLGRVLDVDYGLRPIFSNKAPCAYCTAGHVKSAHAFIPFDMLTVDETEKTHFSS